MADLAAQVVLATSSRPHGGNWSATAESEDKDATTNQTVAGGRDIAVVLRVVTCACSTSATDSCTRNVLALLRKSESSLISSDSAAFADHSRVYKLHLLTKLLCRSAIQFVLVVLLG